MKKIKLESVFNEFTLMGIAVSGAFYLGEYWEGIAVILFYLIGEWFQHKAVHKARSDIKALLDVRPETATVIYNNTYKITVPEKVQPGETIEVKVGEKVPLDGFLLEDSASFNTTALTGESVPRTLYKQEEVLAGMIASDKVVRIKVNKPYDQSTLARILTLVQDAAERKAPAELFIRRFARIYTPIVTGLAILVVILPYLYSLIKPEFIFVFDDWFYRALVFLVISCPCFSNSSFNALSLFTLRAFKIKLAPCEANLRAHPAPIPLEAPVIKTILSILLFRFIKELTEK
jgi:Zn2+/Cd2+-exporting ATPase